MSLPDVHVNDPHVNAHNDERHVVNTLLDLTNTGRLSDDALDGAYAPISVKTAGGITVGKDRSGYNICTLDYASDDLAVQAATNLVTSGVSGGSGVTLGPGIFEFVGGVDLTAKQNLHLRGTLGTIVRWLNGNAFVNTNPGYNYLFTAGAYCVISDLTLRGRSTFTCPINGVGTKPADGTNTLGGALLLTDSRTWIDRVFITGFAEDGITNKGGIGTKYGEVMVVACGGTGLNITNVAATAGYYASDGDLSSVWIGACGKGITVAEGGTWISGAHVWGCQGDGLYIDADNVRVIGGYYETNGGWGINVHGRSRCIIKGNDIWGNGITGGQQGGIFLNGTAAVNNVVTENQLRDNRYHAVLLSSAQYNSIQGNMVTDNISRGSSTPETLNANLTAAGTQPTTTTFIDNNAPAWMATAISAIGLTVQITGAGSAGSTLTAQVVGWNSTTSVTLSTTQVTATTNPSYSLFVTAYGVRETGSAKANSIRANIIHRNDSRIAPISLVNGTTGTDCGDNVGWDAEVWFEASNVNGAISIDIRNGAVYRGNLNGNITGITIFPSNPARGMVLSISFKQDATAGRTVAGWPATVKWASAGVPTFPSAANAVGAVRLRFDGTNWIEVERSI